MDFVWKLYGKTYAVHVNGRVSRCCHIESSFTGPPDSPVSYSAGHQRPARERHKIRIASRENVDNQTPRNTNFTH